MKQLLILMLLLNFILFTAAQQTLQGSPTLSPSEYLVKSKRQKTTGFILAGTGIIVLGTGATITAKGATEETANALGCGLSLGFVCPESTAAQKKQRTGNTIMLTGLGIGLSSIPFFISASKNKRASKNLSIRLMEPVPVDAIVIKKTLPYSVKIKLLLK